MDISLLISTWWPVILAVVLIAVMHQTVHLRAKKLDKKKRMKSRPAEYSGYAAAMSILPAIGFCLALFLLTAVTNAIGRQFEAGSDTHAMLTAFSIPDWAYALVFLAAAVFGGGIALKKFSPEYSARLGIENVIIVLMMVSATVTILTTFGIVLSILVQSIDFFSQVSILHFLTGTEWAPDPHLPPQDELITEGYGALPLFLGTFMVTAVAMLVAVPIGLRAAVFMSEYASHRARGIVKPLLEILAGIPTVVYGFFAALTVAPIIKMAANYVGLDADSENILAAGIVMGIMIIPFMSSLSDDVINAVPESLRQGGLALGLTKAETVKDIVVPAALPGIVSAFLLAISRALGETMIVFMAIGTAANLTVNPLEGAATVTVSIVNALVGDQAFGTPATLSAFALGLALFFVTLALNLVSTIMIRRFKSKYE